MYLVIDTSGKKALVAVGDKMGVMSFGQWLNDNQLSNKIQIEIEKVLTRTKQPVEAVLCVTGPGSFTSLRVGVATANAFGYAKNIPVVPVTRFEIYEKGSLESYDLVILENIKNLIYTKSYSGDNCEYWVGETKNAKLTTTAGRKSKNARLIGEWGPEKKLTLGKIFGLQALQGTGQEIEGKERAELIIKRGLEVLAEMGEKDFTLPITPLYINSPNITKPKS